MKPLKLLFSVLGHNANDPYARKGIFVQAIKPVDITQWISAIENTQSGPCYCPNFLKPVHLVTMGLAIKKHQWSDYYLPSELESYATRMKLWEAMQMNPPFRMNEYSEEGKFMPVQRFDQDKKDMRYVSEMLTKLVIRTASKEYRDALDSCIDELINNFFDHANSMRNLPCLVAAQSWPRGKLIQIAIADAGIGIRNSLSENPEIVDQLVRGNACELAARYGVTSKPNNNHSGYGLTLAKDLMKQSHGTFILISGNELFACNHDDEIETKFDSKWEGTLLVLEWKIDFPLNSKQVYDSWPMPKGFDSDDFF